MKNLKGLFVALAVVVVAVGAFAFTAKKSSHKAFTVVSFQYKTTAPDDPSDADATTSSNYVSATLSASSPVQTLGGIQFNTADFPLNGSSLPDFTITDLATIVKAHKAPAGSTNPATFTINGKNVTFYYRPRQ